MTASIEYIDVMSVTEQGDPAAQRRSMTSRSRTAKRSS
jgi:hypothetical protein